MSSTMSGWGGSRRVRALVLGAGLAATLAGGPAALGDHGRRWSDCSSGSRSSFSISIGSGGYCGPSWGVGYRSWNDCGPRWGYRYRYDSCPPPVYCPPPVVVAPCPPPVVVVPRCDDDFVYRRRVVYSTPVVVERPVEVQRVVERPVYVDRVVEKPVVVERRVVVEKPVVVERPVEVERVVTPTAPTDGAYRNRELGDAYMRLADWSNAARAYGQYVAAWDKDGTAARNLGFAQVATGATREGFTNVTTGYRLEPDLMNRAFRVSDFGGEAGLQALIDAAVRAADSVNTADGWFTVAVLRSMAGQDDGAVTALKKARDAGLPSDLLDTLTLRVSGPRS